MTITDASLCRAVAAAKRMGSIALDIDPAHASVGLCFDRLDRKTVVEAGLAAGVTPQAVDMPGGKGYVLTVRAPIGASSVTFTTEVLRAERLIDLAPSKSGGECVVGSDGP